jgi:opacity protein-like surface antigen
MEGVGILDQVTARVALAVLLALASVQAAAGELDTDPAVLAAQSWLASIDAGQYQQGWEDAADSLRVGATREQWEKNLRRARGDRGPMLSRQVKHAKFTKSSYFDPGSFVEIQFETRFEKRLVSRETVSAIRVMDGSWKVSSYTIK